MSKEIKTEISIAATAELVFRALSDFDAYPSWNPFIRMIHGRPGLGNKLKVTLQIPGSGRMRYRAAIISWDDNKEIRWKGHLRIPGLFNSDIQFTIDESSPGTTTLSLNAVYSGALLFLFSERLKRNREQGFVEMFSALKRHVEGQMILEMESIDTNAPVSATGKIEIEATADRVWELLTDVNLWPEWNPAVSWVRLDGPLIEGSTFTWKAGPGKIRSKVRRLLPGRLISWTGTTFGIKAVHIWRIKSVGENTTIVSTEESWSGLPVRLFKKMMRRKLETAIAEGLSHLKKALEKQ